MTINGDAYPGVQPAIDFLVEADIFGFAWLDETLAVRWRLGRLTEWLPLGENICKATALFFGLEKELLDLQDEHGAMLALPRVGFKGVLGAPGETDPTKADFAKISVEIFWDDRLEAYLIVTSRLHPESDIEFELVKQIRARRLAEDNYNKARAQIVEKQSVLDAIIEYAPAAVAVFDEKLKYIFATRNWAQKFGLELQPLAGQSHSLALADLSAEELARRERCLWGRPAVSGVEAVHLAGGAWRSLQWRHQPWRRADGSVGGIVTFAQDLTDVMERQKQIEEKNAELSRINSELEAFALVLAHDLSAPIRAIRAQARKAGAEQASDGALAAGLEAIEQQAARAAAMISGLLEYATAGARRDLVRPVNLRGLIDAIITSTPGAAAFEFRFEGEWPDKIMASPAPLDLVLRNLIQNAVKHHDRPQGLITLGVAEQESAWVFTVTDDGPGVPPSLEAAVFEPFCMASSAPGKQGGVGLALVKRTVKSQGGIMQLWSDPLKARGAIVKIVWPKVEGDTTGLAADPRKERETIEGQDG